MASERLRWLARRRRREWRLLGLCSTCGKRRPTAGNRTCEECRLRDRRRFVAQYARRKAAGLCVECGFLAREKNGRKLAHCGDCWQRLKGYRCLSG